MKKVKWIFVGAYTRDSSIQSSTCFDPLQDLCYKYNDGKIYARMLSKNGTYLWCEVGPMEWLVDEQSKTLVSRYIHNPGVLYDNDRVSRIKKPFYQKYIDTYVSKEIFQFSKYFEEKRKNEEKSSVSQSQIKSDSTQISGFQGGNTGESAKLKELIKQYRKLEVQTQSEFETGGGYELFKCLHDIINELINYDEIGENVINSFLNLLKPYEEEYYSMFPNLKDGYDINDELIDLMNFQRSLEGKKTTSIEFAGIETEKYDLFDRVGTKLCRDIDGIIGILNKHYNLEDVSEIQAEEMTMKIIPYKIPWYKRIFDNIRRFLGIGNTDIIDVPYEEVSKKDGLSKYNISGGNIGSNNIEISTMDGSKNDVLDDKIPDDNEGEVPK